MGYAEYAYTPGPHGRSLHCVLVGFGTRNTHAWIAIAAWIGAAVRGPESIVSPDPGIFYDA